MNWGYDSNGERYWPMKWMGPLTLDGGIMMPSYVGTPEPGPMTRMNRFAHVYDGVQPSSPRSLFVVLARSWALGSVLAVEEYVKLGERIPDLNFQVEKQDAELDDLWMVLAQWHVQGHHAIVSLLHMEEWYERAGGVQGLPLPIQKLRHSLEHLSEALLEWDRAVRDPSSKRKNWSLDDLEESSVPLRFDLHMIDSIFGLIDLDQVRDRTLMIYQEMESRMKRRRGSAFGDEESTVTDRHEDDQGVGA